MGNCTIFLDIQTSQERQASNLYNKCSENSKSEIVFRTDIFRKLTLGAPVDWSSLDFIVSYYQVTGFANS